MRELDDTVVGLEEDCEEVLADVGNNADLYVANQESTDLISGGRSVALHGSSKTYFIFNRLVLTPS